MLNTFIFVQSYLENVVITVQKIEISIETHLLMLEDKKNCKENKQQKKKKASIQLCIAKGSKLPGKRLMSRSLQ